MEVIRERLTTALVANPQQSAAISAVLQSYFNERLERQRAVSTAQAEARDRNFAMKIDMVFSRLRNSFVDDQDVILEYRQMREFVQNFQMDSAESYQAHHTRLRQTQHQVDGKSVAAAFCMGLIYTKAKSSRSRVTMAAIGEMYEVREHDVQKKLKIYELLTSLPRLWRCKVPVSFLHENATLILTEYRFQHDAALWSEVPQFLPHGNVAAPAAGQPPNEEPMTS